MKLALLVLLSCICQCVVLANPIPKDDPERNFEEFWQLFNHHYAHFETRGVNWKKQYERFRPQVDSHTTNEKLLSIFNEMVAPLKDGHVVISPTGDLPASAKYSRFYQEFPTKELQSKFHQVTLTRLQSQGFGPFVKFRSDPYQIGGYCRSKELGYLQLNGFGGMSLADFAKQLDEMVIEFADVKGLIIDIRINGGGSPDFLWALVGRLTQVKRLVGYARTRVSKPKFEYTPWGAYQVSPQGPKQLIKPTVLLTSGATISAADHCAMYLKEFPYVKLIGENTNGIFSPMLGKTLPNGWEISLSDGQTVSSKRVNYEGKGVPVDVVGLHYQNDMLQGRDPVLKQAIDYLNLNQLELAKQTICYEQIALDFYADSLLRNKTYGDVTAYSTGLVEEDATLLAPFAQKCYSLQSVYSSKGLQARIQAEQVADSTFYSQNVQSRFYVRLQPPIRSKMKWPFVKRNARRLTVAYHVAIDNKNYVRLHLSQGGWKGETVLVVVDNKGQVVEHCFLSYNYLTSQFYK
jgi:Peptidase family S41/Tricorn protease C1 domain